MTDLLPLPELAESGGSDILAWVAGRPLQRQAFRAMIRGCAARLAGAPGTRWALVCSCPVAFAAGFLALLRQGREPVILPHAQPGLLGEAAGLTDGLVTDGLGDGFVGPIVTVPSDAEVADSSVPAAAGWATRLALFTSGSTGAPQLIEKPLSCIEAELRTLEKTFGGTLERCTVLATVSHQHIYGLLFRVLWPLAAKRPLVDTTIGFPEDLHAQLESFGPAYLVTSPAFLKRTARFLDRGRLIESCRMVISSGAALPETLAADLNRELGDRVVEGYGSTETGGVAWRIVRDAEDWGWTPFPGVTTEIVDELLRVRSPHLPDDGWFVTEDRAAAQANGTFRLLGRSDRVVKIEEKRIDLIDLESRLQAHRDLAEARALVLEGAHRSRLAVVAVPSESGWQALRELGKAGFRTRLADHLDGYFERVTQPRRWRFVSGLPETPQGKVTHQALAALFDEGGARRLLPDIVLETVDGTEATLDLRVPRDLYVLRGHFPDMPVVAGVAQLGWVCHFARQTLGIDRPVERLEALKFRKILPPETLIRLVLRHDTARGKVGFQIEGEEGLYASGRLCLGAER
jgi:hypothetical protein